MKAEIISWRRNGNNGENGGENIWRHGNGIGIMAKAAAASAAASIMAIGVAVSGIGISVNNEKNKIKKIIISWCASGMAGIETTWRIASGKNASRRNEWRYHRRRGEIAKRSENGVAYMA